MLPETPNVQQFAIRFNPILDVEVLQQIFWKKFDRDQSNCLHIFGPIQIALQQSDALGGRTGQQQSI